MINMMAIDDMINSMGRPGQQEHPDQDRQRDPTAQACNDLEQSATEKVKNPCINECKWGKNYFQNVKHVNIKQILSHLSIIPAKSPS